MIAGGSGDADSARFARDEDGAKERFERFKAVDPFPDIAPALLNSADIADYIAATGMVFPFEEEELKPASYGVRLCGQCIYWDDRGGKEEFILSSKKIAMYDYLEHAPEFILKSNSIAYVTLQPTFRIPQYIAMRFNLKIKHVYRGFLLGTGPLVDPGFVGKLSFPLHNLTNEEYRVREDELFVYLEFTKLSRWREWEQEAVQPGVARFGAYRPFDPRKLLRHDINDYLDHATGGRAVRSSIPVALAQATHGVEQARRQVNRLRNWLTGIGVSVAIVVVLTALGVILQINSLIKDAIVETSEVRAEIGSLKADYEGRFISPITIQDLKNRISGLEERDGRAKTAEHRVKLQALERDVLRLQTEMEALISRSESGRTVAE